MSTVSTLWVFRNFFKGILNSQMHCKSIMYGLILYFYFKMNQLMEAKHSSSSNSVRKLGSRLVF